GTRKRIKVLNPVDSEEDFTEKWDSDPEYYRQFISFMKSFKEKWGLLNGSNFGIAEELFGSSRTKSVITEQLNELAKGQNHPLEKTAAKVLTGAGLYNKSGNPSPIGYQSKPNRNFGGVENFPEYSPKQVLTDPGYIAIQIQKYLIDKNFPWLKTVLSDGKLLAKGSI